MRGRNPHPFVLGRSRIDTPKRPWWGVAFGAVLAFLGAVFGGLLTDVFSPWWSSSLERSRQLLQMREEAYIDLLTLSYGTPEDAALRRCMARVAAIGEGDVLMEAAAFEAVLRIEVTGANTASGLRGAVEEFLRDDETAVNSRGFLPTALQYSAQNRAREAIRLASLEILGDPDLVGKGDGLPLDHVLRKAQRLLAEKFAAAVRKSLGY